MMITPMKKKGQYPCTWSLYDYIIYSRTPVNRPKGNLS